MKNAGLLQNINLNYDNKSLLWIEVGALVARQVKKRLHSASGNPIRRLSFSTSCTASEKAAFRTWALQRLYYFKPSGSPSAQQFFCLALKQKIYAVEKDRKERASPS